MKSILIWLIALIIGGLAGYIVGYSFGLNAFLWAGLGVIIGSSAGITINVHRMRDEKFVEDDIDDESSIPA